jgi:hypothetical protein
MPDSEGSLLWRCPRRRDTSTPSRTSAPSRRCGAAPIAAPDVPRPACRLQLLRQGAPKCLFVRRPGRSSQVLPKQIVRQWQVAAPCCIRPPAKLQQYVVVYVRGSLRLAPLGHCRTALSLPEGIHVKYHTPAALRLEEAPGSADDRGEVESGPAQEALGRDLTIDGDPRVTGVVL